jgi:hypothetical protein
MASTAQGGQQHLGNALFEQAHKFSKVSVLVHLLYKIKYNNGTFSVKSLNREDCRDSIWGMKRALFEQAHSQKQNHVSIS